MEKVIKSIKDYYEGTLIKTSDFENSLNECSKEDLVEFIIAHQCRGCFKGVIYD